MTESVLYFLAVLLVLGASGLLLRRPRAGASPLSRTHASTLEFFPIHCRYFPQVRHALSSEDAPYLAAHTSPGVYRRWRKSIRRAGRSYLAALREDFSRLNRVARVVALYSSQVNFRQEVDLFRLNLRFQLLYGIVLSRFLLGLPAGDRLGQMASLIGSLGSRLEQAALAPDISSGALTP